MVRVVYLLLFLTVCLHNSLVQAARPTVAQALGLKPIQKDVDFDTPAADAIEACTLKAEKIGSDTGWVVRTGEGTLLRRFIDTNGDNKVDRWCYFKDGIEVYRDIDQDFNGKADQYRWLGTAGTRWGSDPDENGVINRWQQISAEEVSSEIVAALRDKDRLRFQRLLPNAEELGSMGLGKDRFDTIKQSIDRANDQFSSLSRTQKIVNSKTKWLHFGATRPALIPEGTDGSTKDVTVYENVVAIVETDGEPGQVPLGTMVQIDGAWRIVDLPVASGADANSSLTGMFLNASHASGTGSRPNELQARASEWTKHIAQLEAIDKQIATAKTVEKQSQLNASRADVIEQLIKSLPEDERPTWIRQFADTVSAASQSGQYPEGAARLRQFYGKISTTIKDKDLQAYVKYRWLNADYNRQLRATMGKPDADVAKIQASWLKVLAAYVKEFPDSPDSAEAMLQLAIAEEFSGKDTVAKAWYRKIAEEFPTDNRAKKAVGAIRRLDSVGKTIPLAGATFDGKNVDLKRYEGRMVVIHYWATWCEPCKQDMKALAALHAKYRAKGFEVIGVNLDTDKEPAAAYVREKRYTWPMLFEDGGLESRLANEMGILTLPTMLLVDKKGKVVNRALHAGQIEEELNKQL